MAKNGRPSGYIEEYAEQARQLCELGATDVELAKFFKVSAVTILNWKRQYPQFLLALKTAKEHADERVERSLYQRAIGFSFKSVKIFLPKAAEGEAQEPVYAPFQEYMPPDVTACIFWLKNRRPDLWRDKREIDAKINDKRNPSELTNDELDRRVEDTLVRVEALTKGKAGPAPSEDGPPDIRKRH